ncbi:MULTISPECIES: hypothetical protein [unclassified Mucilaginibacter]|uniref:hypothetical protein n=1 Tax=unclassified Mucilaginibacter TaxID=2617802 RepID=UPI0031F60A53
MKIVIFSALLVALSLGNASAQTDAAKVQVDWSAVVPTANVAAQVGKKVAVCDTVYDYRVVSEALTLLNLGGRYPNQRLTVTVKGAGVKINAAAMKGKPACFYGEVTMFKNRPELVVTEPDQIKNIKQYQ